MRINPDTMTEEQREQFISGWEEAGGYMDDCDGEISTPWCMPWYGGTSFIEVSGETPKEWGAEYWEQCRPEIEEIIQEAYTKGQE